MPGAPGSSEIPAGPPANTNTTTPHRTAMPASGAPLTHEKRHWSMPATAVGKGGKSICKNASQAHRPQIRNAYKQPPTRQGNAATRPAQWAARCRGDSPSAAIAGRPTSQQHRQSAPKQLPTYSRQATPQEPCDLRRPNQCELAAPISCHTRPPAKAVAHATEAVPRKSNKRESCRWWTNGKAC